MRWLDRKASTKTYSVCLQTVRLMSRDKAGLDTLMTSDVLATLVRHSGLDSYSQSQGELITNQQADPNGTLRNQTGAYFSFVFRLFQHFLLMTILFYFWGDFLTNHAPFCSESSFFSMSYFCSKSLCCQLSTQFCIIIPFVFTVCALFKYNWWIADQCGLIGFWKAMDIKITFPFLLYLLCYNFILYSYLFNAIISYFIPMFSMLYFLYPGVDIYVTRQPEKDLRNK